MIVRQACTMNLLLKLEGVHEIGIEALEAPRPFLKLDFGHLFGIGRPRKNEKQTAVGGVGGRQPDIHRIGRDDDARQNLVVARILKFDLRRACNGAMNYCVEDVHFRVPNGQ